VFRILRRKDRLLTSRFSGIRDGVRRLTIRTSLIMALCLSMQAQTPSGVRLYPVDDTARDPAFRSYIRKLRSAVDRRNTAALRKLVDHDVVVGSTDADKGWNRFNARWRVDNDENSPVWAVLSDLLTLGFIQEHPRLFLSPYLVWRFPRGLSMATHLVVIRGDAALRDAPSSRAPSSASLSFDIVQRLGQVEQTEGLVQWIHVRTLDGKTGYLAARDVMSPLMPRAQFGMRSGRWLLIALEGPEE
jgi:hypothetical protein